ncbi:hypothetical protein A989_05692 [Xanthomonas translucens DAR61454]|uniref:Putative membrane protein n=2 Tax=Xanthomonas graminis TaxID=3390026 RepID=A0A0K2ZCE9_9XANT|nr:putative peptide [Xanthomonas translucens pv. graminis ART-Xtg29]ELQ13777.1 hypothetical protein A989_05692 [Xanthomonas translucens DAR61454]CTP82941.1 putative membrane protein [Xanthomonas translucens pv. phlei]SBV42971.1 putative membrane protein [Xanthomonas translucens pv. graminis]SBV43793.1 putative membrane protein [Xanthomonas translucens pv. graminis]
MTRRESIAIGIVVVIAKAATFYLLYRLLI